MMRRLVLLVVFVPGMLGLAAAPADAQASLSKARELYASAAYDEALAMLDGLQSGSQPEDRPAIAMYHVLCLVALGRSQDVDTAIETLVSHHPLYRPPVDELSPRMRSAFTEARRRLLPRVIQEQYAEAKGAFDRGDFAAAVLGFRRVLDIVEEPEIAHAAAQPPLTDIRVLAAGFRQLSEKALAPPPPPPAPAPLVIVPPAPVRDYRRVYTPTDADVVPPVTIRQSVPRFPGRMTSRGAGTLEVVIDATGVVESARMIAPVHPQYDQLVVSAAKKWQYEPARIDGVPVKYLKLVQVTLEPGP